MSCWNVGIARWDPEVGVGGSCGLGCEGAKRHESPMPSSSGGKPKLCHGENGDERARVVCAVAQSKRGRVDHLVIRTVTCRLPCSDSTAWSPRFSLQQRGICALSILRLHPRC